MPAPMFPANAHCYDPYRTVKFQVEIGGKTIAGLPKMGALKKTTEVVNWRAAGDAGMSLLNFRRDVVINVLKLQDTPAISYVLRRAFVTEYQALPEMDANSMNAVGIQSVTLAYEGFTRDTAVAEPSES